MGCEPECGILAYATRKMAATEKEERFLCAMHVNKGDDATAVLL